MSDDDPSDMDLLRTDTWANFVTGVGTFMDKSAHGRYIAPPRLDDATLDALYDADALVARIVDLPADEMTRAGFDLESPGTRFDWSPVAAMLDRQNALATIGDAIRWSRLYGGTLLVFEVEDGRKPELPLDLGAAKVLTRALVVEAHYAVPYAGTLDDPEVWEIGEPNAGARRLVHKSRVIRFDGVRTSPGARRRHGRHGWGPSVCDRVLESVQRLGTVMGYMANVMHEVSLPVMRIDGLRKMLLAPNGRANVREVLQSIKDSIDILHMLAIDKNDEFSDVSREVRGLVELGGEFKGAVAWSTDMPSELVFNVMEGGLNTGALSGPIRNWYDRTAKKRNDVVTPPVRKWVEILGAVNKLNVPEYTVEHRPLWQESSKESADAAGVRATSDRTYFDMGVLDADEIRHARFIATTDGGFAVDEEPEDEETPTNLVALPGAGEPLPEVIVGEPGETETPPPAIDIAGVLSITAAAKAGNIPREGAIALLSIAFPVLKPVVGVLVDPPPPPAAPVDPNAPPPEDEGLDVELAVADYDPPDTPLSPQEVGSRFNVSAGVIRAMHKRGEIGGWKVGGRWRYSPSEVAQSAHRPKAAKAPPEGEPPPPAVGGATPGV